MATVAPSRQALRGLPARVYAFLREVGTSRATRAALARKGYAPKSHAEGWRLLDRVSGRDCSFDVEVEAPNDALQTWEKDDGKRMHALIAKEHPRYLWLFERLPLLGEKAAAPIRVGQLLAWLDDLEEAPRRAATHDA